jgi:hypothetical protein
MIKAQPARHRRCFRGFAIGLCDPPYQTFGHVNEGLNCFARGLVKMATKRRRRSWRW